MCFHILEADNGEDAIKAAAEYRPHLIIMNLNMPVLNGFETTRKIRLAEPENWSTQI